MHYLAILLKRITFLPLMCILEMKSYDLNNGRGHEWLENIIKNLETMYFFDYIPCQNYGDEFIVPYAISAVTFAKRVFNETLPENCSYEQFLEYWHKDGFEDLWE